MSAEATATSDGDGEARRGGKVEIDGEETRSVDSSGSGDDDEGSEEQGEAGKDGEETRSAGNEEIGWLDAGWGWEGRSVSTSSTIVPIGTILASHVVHRKDGRHTHGVGCGFERACAGPLLGRHIPPATPSTLHPIPNPRLTRVPYSPKS